MDLNMDLTFSTSFDFFNKYNLSNRKQNFYSLFLTSNFLPNYIIELSLVEPIIYKQYFSLTKLLCCSFLDFQKAPFLSCNSTFCVFLENSKKFDITKYNDFTMEKVSCSFETLKQFLKSFKNKTIHRFRILQDFYVNKNEIINNINFVEELTKKDSRYKNTSIRQCKSNFNRKIKFITNNFYNSTDLFENVTDLIFVFYLDFDKIWHLHHFLNLYQKTIPPHIMSCYMENLDLEILTTSDIDLEEI